MTGDETVRLVDRAARQVAIAAVEWLASDGAEDLFDAFETAVERWKALVLDGE